MYNNRIATQPTSSSRSQVNGFSSVIGEKLTISAGKVTSDDIRVDGVIEVPLESDGRVLIGQTGRVSGNVTANVIIVAGEIRGDLFASEVEVQSTGSVYGNVHTQNLISERGAYIEGQVRMESVDESSDAVDDDSFEEVVD